MALLAIKQIEFLPDARLVSESQIANWDNKLDLSLVGAPDGVAGLNFDGKVPLNQLSLDNQQRRVVSNIAARDALTDIVNGTSVLVTDATDDISVNSGGAYYIYNDGLWIKIAETESVDIIFNWDAIDNRLETAIEELQFVGGTLGPLSYSPVDITEVILYVNGVQYKSGEGFSIANGNVINWSVGNAGFSIDESDHIVAQYEYKAAAIVHNRGGSGVAPAGSAPAGI